MHDFSFYVMSGTPKKVINFLCVFPSVPQCPAGGNGCVVVEERITTLQVSHCAELLAEGIPGPPHQSRATDGFRHTYGQGERSLKVKPGVGVCAEKRYCKFV